MSRASGSEMGLARFEPAERYVRSLANSAIGATSSTLIHALAG